MIIEVKPVAQPFETWHGNQPSGHGSCVGQAVIHWRPPVSMNTVFIHSDYVSEIAQNSTLVPVVRWLCGRCE